MTNFYEGKRVCVTGGAGFVGVQLVKKLVTAGAKVWVLDDLSRGNNHVEGPSYIHSDATRVGTCEYAFRGANTRGEPMDMVFNLVASVAGVLHNQDHHTSMFKENIGLQMAPLLAARKAGVKNFLQTSSVCVYAPHLNHPSREENGHTLVPHIANDGYAWSKRMGERAVGWGGLERAVIVRPSNVFGIHDYYDEKAHVIPALLKKLHDPGDEIILYGSEVAVREFVWSEDVADGMMVVMEHGKNLEAYNIGNDSEHNRIGMGMLLLDLMDITGIFKEIVSEPGRGGGDELRWSDSSKAGLIGYSPKMNLHAGLEAIVEAEWKLK